MDGSPDELPEDLRYAPPARLARFLRTRVLGGLACLALMAAVAWAARAALFAAPARLDAGAAPPGARELLLHVAAGVGPALLAPLLVGTHLLGRAAQHLALARAGAGARLVLHAEGLALDRRAGRVA